MKTLHLQETPTAICFGGTHHTLTGQYNLIGKVEATDYLLVECQDTYELFVINKNLR